MLKLVVALALVAVVSARYDAYIVKIVDNQIIVDSDNGRYVKIVSQYMPQKFIQLYVNGPDVPQTTYHYLDNQVAQAGVYQSDILYQIFNRFFGVLKNQQYSELLTLVEKYVENGEIDPSVLYALQYVFYQDQTYLRFGQYYNQELYQGERYNTGLGYLFGKEGYNKYFGSYRGQYQQQYPYSKYYGNYYGSYQGQYPRYSQNRGHEYTKPSVYQYEGYYGPYSGNYPQVYGQQYQYGLGQASQYYKYPTQY